MKGEQGLYDHSRNFFSFRQKLFYEMDNDDEHYTSQLAKVKNLNSKYELTSIIMAILWSIHLKIFDMRVLRSDNSRILHKNQDVKQEIFSEKSIITMLTSNDTSSKFWASSIYSRFLISSTLHEIKFHLDVRRNKNQAGVEFKAFFFKYKDWPQVLLVLNVDIKKYKIFVQNLEFDSFGNLWLYSNAISKLLSKIFRSTGDYYTGSSDLENAVQEEIYNELTGKDENYLIGNLRLFSGEEIDEKDERQPINMDIKRFHKVSLHRLEELKRTYGVYNKILNIVGLSFNNSDLDQILFPGVLRKKGVHMITPWKMAFNKDNIFMYQDKILLRDTVPRDFKIEIDTIVAIDPTFTESIILTDKWLLNGIIGSYFVHIDNSFLRNYGPKLQDTKLIRRLECCMCLNFIDMDYLVKNALILGFINEIIDNNNKIAIYKDSRLLPLLPADALYTQGEINIGNLNVILTFSYNKYIAVMEKFQEMNIIMSKNQTFKTFIFSSVLYELLTQKINVAESKVMSYQYAVRSEIEMVFVIDDYIKDKPKRGKTMFKEIKQKLNKIKYKSMGIIVNYFEEEMMMKFDFTIQDEVGEEEIGFHRTFITVNDLINKFITIKDTKKLLTIRHLDNNIMNREKVSVILGELYQIKERFHQVMIHFNKEFEYVYMLNLVNKLLYTYSYTTIEANQLNKLINFYDVYDTPGINNLNKNLLEIITSKFEKGNTRNIISATFDTFYIKKGVFDSLTTIYDRLLLYKILESSKNYSAMSIIDSICTI